jgi:hypothetical protein
MPDSLSISLQRYRPIPVLRPVWRSNTLSFDCVGIPEQAAECVEAVLVDLPNPLLGVLRHLPEALFTGS